MLPDVAPEFAGRPRDGPPAAGPIPPSLTMLSPDPALRRGGARLAAALLAPLGLGAAGATGAAGLTLVLDGVAEGRGEVRVALYPDRERFDEREPFATASRPAAATRLEITFERVPAGRYAMLVYQDIDGDGELGRGAWGIPDEPWTGSTTGTRLRAPSWPAYAFELPAHGMSMRLAL